MGQNNQTIRKAVPKEKVMTVEQVSEILHDMHDAITRTYMYYTTHPKYQKKEDIILNVTVSVPHFSASIYKNLKAKTSDFVLEGVVSTWDSVRLPPITNYRNIQTLINKIAPFIVRVLPTRDQDLKSHYKVIHLYKPFILVKCDSIKLLETIPYSANQLKADYKKLSEKIGVTPYMVTKKDIQNRKF